MGLINDLLDKANKDSKKKLNKEDQRLYVTTLHNQFKENGLSDENLFYLVSGLKFGTIKTFVMWNHTLEAEKQLENIKKVIDYKKVRAMDNTVKLKMFLMLLIAELNEVTANDIVVGELLHWLVELSYKKDGTRLSDLGKIFKNYFLNDMKHGTRLPSLGTYNFQKTYEIQLLYLFEDAINGIEAKGDEEIEKRNLLRKWIKSERGKADEIAQESEDDKIIETKETNENEINAEKSNDKKNELRIKSLLGKRLMEMAKSMDEFDEMYRASIGECKKKEREIASLKTNLDKLEKLYASTSDENTSLRKQLEEMKCSYEESIRVNKELEERVNRQVSVIDVYDQDKANTKTELLNQIATALKKIYMDYKVAETMEMTLDLGENMRDSLDDVFRKLKKMGIDIEGR